MSFLQAVGAWFKRNFVAVTFIGAGVLIGVVGLLVHGLDAMFSGFGVAGSYAIGAFVPRGKRQA